MFVHLIGLILFFQSPNVVKDRVVPVYTYNEFKPLLHKKSDTVYVINFWATWCKPCIKELPHFDNLESHFAGKKVKVILVSLDFRENVKTQLVPFLDKKKIKSEVVVLDDPNANAWIENIDPDWSGAIPATIIYSKNKRDFFEKEFSEEELNKTVSNYLND